MDNTKNYEAIAREAGFGFVVIESISGWFGYYWYSEVKGIGSSEYYSTQEEAWKACCVENGLV